VRKYTERERKLLHRNAGTHADLLLIELRKRVNRKDRARFARFLIRLLRMLETPESVIVLAETLLDLRGRDERLYAPLKEPRFEHTKARRSKAARHLRRNPRASTNATAKVSGATWRQVRDWKKDPSFQKLLRKSD
jgi:hypothetical protein